jgi:hypothetical protein
MFDRFSFVILRADLYSILFFYCFCLGLRGMALRTISVLLGMFCFCVGFGWFVLAALAGEAGVMSVDYFVSTFQLASYSQADLSPWQVVALLLVVGSLVYPRQRRLFASDWVKSGQEKDGENLTTEVF